MNPLRYKVLETKSPSALEAEVEKWIERGWMPTGGVSVSGDWSTGIYWAQAMVLYKRVEVPEPSELEKIFGDKHGRN